MSWHRGPAAHLQILIVFIKKLWENVGQISQRNIIEYLFSSSRISFYQSRKLERRKEGFEEVDDDQHEAEFQHSKQSRCRTINNVTFSVWGVTVFITTDQEFWHFSPFLGGLVLTIVCGLAAGREKGRSYMWKWNVFDLQTLLWNNTNISQTPLAELWGPSNQQYLKYKNTNPGENLFYFLCAWSSIWIENVVEYYS